MSTHVQESKGSSFTKRVLGSLKVIGESPLRRSLVAAASSDLSGHQRPQSCSIHCHHVFKHGHELVRCMGFCMQTKRPFVKVSFKHWLQLKRDAIQALAIQAPERSNHCRLKLESLINLFRILHKDDTHTQEVYKMTRTLEKCTR